MKISHLGMPKRPVSVTHGAMDDMPKGMMRRGGAYSLRRRIPVDLIGAYGGRKEIVRALGTNDYGRLNGFTPACGWHSMTSFRAIGLIW